MNRVAVEGLVCPSVLQNGIFTTAAVDNIDHNPSLMTSHSSFHGTGICMFQHKRLEKPSRERIVLKLLHSDQESKKYQPFQMHTQMCMFKHGHPNPPEQLNINIWGIILNCSLSICA